MIHARVPLLLFFISPRVFFRLAVLVVTGACPVTTDLLKYQVRVEVTTTTTTSTTSTTATTTTTTTTTIVAAAAAAASVGAKTSGGAVSDGCCVH